MSLVQKSAVALVMGLVVAVAGTPKAGDKAADTKKADTKSDTKAADKTADKTADKPPHHAVPKYYAKIGISDAQKDSIYKIQDTYAVDLKKLQDQLDAAMAKRDAEIRAVLTPEQLKLLDAAIAAGKKTDEKMDDPKTDTKTDKKAETKPVEKPKTTTPDPVKPSK